LINYDIIDHVIPEQHLRRRVAVTLLSSISINVIPSFGHIVNVGEGDKNKVVITFLM
jgi:hypothetical protein